MTGSPAVEILLVVVRRAIEYYPEDIGIVPGISVKSHMSYAKELYTPAWLMTEVQVLSCPQTALYFVIPLSYTEALHCYMKDKVFYLKKL